MLLRLIPVLLVAFPAVAQKKLATEVDDLARSVAKLRGLTIKKPIARGVMSRAQITERILERLDEDYAEADVAGEERAMKRLGLLPADLDYKQTVVKLLTEQVAGFYDPHRKELYIADWIGDEMQRIVLVHEIDHALQDQHFDLVSFIKPNKENSDEQVGRQALAEGDGMAIMVEYLAPGIDPWADDRVVNMVAGMSGLSAGSEFDKAPLVLKEALLFPYEKGLRFVAAVRRTRPWSAVSAIYASPPASSEQIIHPEKYQAKEKPVAVRVTTPASLKGWKRAWSNVLGELQFSVFFRQHGVDKQRATRAAEGWGGDRLHLYAPPGDDGKGIGGLLVVDWSAWDAEADAIEVYDAIVEAMPKLAEKAVDKRETYAEWSMAGGLAAFTERKGDRVLLVVGAPAATAQKLRAELWAGWKK